MTARPSHRSPGALAVHFAAHVRRFYDRDAFDALARHAAARLTRYSARNGHTFVDTLNRRLAARGERPIRWEDPVG